MRSSIVSAGVAVAMLGGSAFARGRLAGRVTDLEGLALPGAAVVVEGALLDDASTVFTSEDGTFEFSDLPTARYSLTFSIPGFAPAVREGLDVAGADAPVTVEVALRTGVTGRLTISGPAPLAPRVRRALDGDRVALESRDGDQRGL